MFYRKVVHNGNAEGCKEISVEVIHKAIDDPWFHRWTVGGDYRLKVQAFESNPGKCD